MEQASHDNEFYVGVIVDLIQLNSPSILVSNDNTDSVDFTVLSGDPQFQQINATVENGSVASVSLPQPSLSSHIDSDRALMGFKVLTETESSVKVFLSPDGSDIFPVFPFKLQATQRDIQFPYIYHMFPAAGTEQPLTRTTLLLIGCQDATSIQVISTDMLSLPVSLNATASTSPSDSVTTSFFMDELDTAAIQLTGDVLKTYVLSNKPLTVTLVSTADCFRLTSTGFSGAPCGSSYTQLTPSLTWGRRFLVSSRPGSDPGAKYMIQTGFGTSTSVLVICSNSTHTNSRLFSQNLSLEQLTRFLLRVSNKHYCSIESQNPVQVVQYSLQETRGIDTVFPLLIQPTEQYSIIDSAILPLQPQDQGESVREFKLHATILVPVLGHDEHDSQIKNNILVDGEPVSQQWNDIFCRNSRLCGYAIDIPLPLQSSVNISHKISNLPASVIIHRGGANPYSYSAGFRLNDLTGRDL